MFDVAVALVLTRNHHGKTVLLAEPVRNTADLMIAAFIGVVFPIVHKGHGVEDQMIMNMVFVNMGGKYKLVLVTQYFFLPAPARFDVPPPA